MGPSVKHVLGVQEWSYVVPEKPFFKNRVKPSLIFVPCMLNGRKKLNVEQVSDGEDALHRENVKYILWSVSAFPTRFQIFWGKKEKDAVLQVGPNSVHLSRGESLESCSI